MNALILWLNKRKVIALVTSLLYFAATVLLHEKVSKISVWLQKSLTLKLYNTLITIFSISVAIFFSIYPLLKFKKAEREVLKVFYLFFAFLLAVVSYNTLIASNIEAIHFPQYAFLTLPVFALTMSFSETLLSVSLLGALDEAYQYFIFKNWTYFDFNDILLNVIGGCLGVAFLFIVLNKETFLSRQDPRGLMKSPAFVTTAGLLMAALVLSAVGLLQVYPPHDGSKAFILLSKKPPPESFWISFKWGKRYHILSPMEGIALYGALIGCYTFMDRKARSGNG